MPGHELLLLRHGETEWSRDGRHTGRTDIPLTDRGEQQARAVAPLLADRHFALVLVSPLQRARRTAELAGLTDGVSEPGLVEWDYGDYEGLTTPEIRDRRPGWWLWSDGVPHGESVTDVGARADRVLARVGPAIDEGDVAVVGHGHALRVLTARWLELAAVEGARFRLDTATLSVLGFEHDRPVLRRWNVESGV